MAAALRAATARLLALRLAFGSTERRRGRRRSSQSRPQKAPPINNPLNHPGNFRLVMTTLLPGKAPNHF
jgi:hypothetical protein